VIHLRTPTDRPRTCIKGTRSTDGEMGKRNEGNYDGFTWRQIGWGCVFLQGLGLVKIWDHNSLDHPSVVNTSAARRPTAVPLTRCKTGWSSNLCCSMNVALEGPGVGVGGCASRSWCRLQCGGSGAEEPSWRRAAAGGGENHRGQT
jgi:hypothetical protein